MIISCGYTRKCCNSIAKGKQTTCENGQRRSQLAAVVYKLGSNTVPRQGRRLRDLVEGGRLEGAIYPGCYLGRDDPTFMYKGYILN